MGRNCSSSAVGRWPLALNHAATQLYGWRSPIEKSPDSEHQYQDGCGRRRGDRGGRDRRDDCRARDRDVQVKIVSDSWTADHAAHAWPAQFRWWRRRRTATHASLFMARAAWASTGWRRAAGRPRAPAPRTAAPDTAQHRGGGCRAGRKWHGRSGADWRTAVGPRQRFSFRAAVSSAGAIPGRPGGRRYTCGGRARGGREAGGAARQRRRQAPPGQARLRERSTSVAGNRRGGGTQTDL